jgi:hypothetical protein
MNSHDLSAVLFSIEEDKECEDDGTILRCPCISYFDRSFPTFTLELNEEFTFYIQPSIYLSFDSENMNCKVNF